MWVANVCYMALVGQKLQSYLWQLGMHACMEVFALLALWLWRVFFFGFHGLHKCTTQLLLGESTIDLLHYIPPRT